MTWEIIIFGVGYGHYNRARYLHSGEQPRDPKWWNIGIRIEDDVLITNDSPVNLSAGAPRDWKSIEELMKEGVL